MQVPPFLSGIFKTNLVRHTSPYGAQQRFQADKMRVI